MFTFTPIGGKVLMKGELKFYNKEVLDTNHVLEIKIWEIPVSADYPEGFKYSFILIEPKTGKKILMDNHKPKKHHFHINEKEFDYNFRGINKLFNDFKKLVFKHLEVKL